MQRPLSLLRALVFIAGALLLPGSARAAFPEGVLPQLLSEACKGGPKSSPTNMYDIRLTHTSCPTLDYTYSAATDGLRCGSQPAVTTPSTKARYPLDGDVVDATGLTISTSMVRCSNAANACCVPSNFYGGAGRFGDYNRGYLNCGGDLHEAFWDIESGALPGLDNRSFSIEFWVRGSDVAWEPTIMRHCPGGGQNECMDIYQGNGAAEDGKLKVRWGGATNTVLMTDASWASGTNLGLDNGQWHYVVFVYDAATKLRQIYIDGEPRGSDNAPTGEHYKGGSGCIAFNRNGCGAVGAGVPGRRDLDDVRFSEAVLTYAQIRARFRGTHYYYTTGGALQTPVSLGCSDGSTGVNNASLTQTSPGFSTAGANRFDQRTFSRTEALRMETFLFNYDDNTLATPPTPRVSAVTTTGITWNWDPTLFTPAQARYVCDASGGRTVYARIEDGAALAGTASKSHTGVYTPNVRHCLKINATYTDTGCSGVPVGPSADTPEVCRYTLAAVPAAAPVIAAEVDGTTVDLTLDQAPNASPTGLNVETSTGGLFNQIGTYMNVPPGTRRVTGLAKSARHFFRTRAINGDGIQTDPTAASSSGGSALAPNAGSFVTMPETPAVFGGEPSPLPQCGKTAIRWSWNAIAAGSGGPTTYTVRDAANTATYCTATSPATTCDQTGLPASALGTPRTAKMRARDALAPFPDGDFSLVESGTTASSDIPQVQNLSGTALSPTSVRWDWTAPPYLCAGWTYQVSFTEPVQAPVTLAADSAPQYTQSSMPVNSKSRVRLQAFDPIDTDGSPLSLEASQYSLANPPTNLRAPAISTDSLVVAWDDNGNPAYTRYAVDLSPDAGATTQSRIAVGHNHTALSATLASLIPGHSYRVTVKAFNGAGGQTPEVPTATISADFVTQTTAPTLSGTPIGTTQVTWSWTQVGNGASYQLRDARDGSLLATVAPPAAMTYTQTNVVPPAAPNTQLSAYVWAFNTAGMAQTSATSYVYTDAAAPTSAAWTAVSSNSVTLSWDRNGNPNPGTLYEVNVSTDPLYQIVIQTRGSTTPSAKINDLFPASTFYARVRALSGSGRASSWARVEAAGVPLAAHTDTSPAVTLSSSPASVYVPDGSVVGLWHFDDDFGVSSTTDRSANAGHARRTCGLSLCVSTPTFVAGMPTLSTAIAFSGQVSSLVFAPYIPAYDFLGSLTIAAWVKPGTASQPTETTLVARQSRANGLDFALDLENNGSGARYRFRVGTAAADEVIAPAGAFGAGRWQRVAGVYDSSGGGTITIAVDGVPVASKSGVAARTARADGHIMIGNRERGGPAWTFDRGFIGAIDEVRLLGQAWSAAELAADYAGSFVSTLTLSGPMAGISLALAPNAFGGLATIYASRDPINNPIVIDRVTLANGLALTPTGQVLVPDTLVEIVPAVGGLPFSGAMGSSATITMTYGDADGDGLLDGVQPPLAAHTLRMYTLDTSVLRWVALPTVVDRQARTVAGVTPHFSVFGVFGAATIGSTISHIKLFPNPWRRGSKGRYDAPALTFDNLPQSGLIRIFTLSGERVTDILFDGSAAGTVQWNGKNFSGRDVASGVYFAYIKGLDGSSTSVTKFAIER